MPKDNVTSFVNEHFVDCSASNAWTKTGFDRLRTYLGKVKKGQPKIYTAPFAKGVEIQKVLDDWKDVLESVRDKWPSLWDFENDLANKVGPLSVQKPLEDRLPDIAHYYWDILLPSEPIDERAIYAVQGEFLRLRGLRIRSEGDTVDRMRKSTNSGNPYFTKRRNVVTATLPIHIYTHEGRHPDVYGELGRWNGDQVAVVGWRGQEGGPDIDDVKQRVVWMFPFALNIAELQVYQPLIEASQRLNLVPAWVGMDQVDKRVTDLFDSKKPNDLVVCTDFSRFDQHFNRHLQSAAKTILRGILTPGWKSHEYWLSEIFPAKYLIPLCWDAYQYRDNSFYTVFEGEHGMASGSGGTNVDETLAHRALQYEAAMHGGTELNRYSQCLGDDGILSYPGITVNKVIAAYKSHGLEMNQSKQYASNEDCVYLRRWHHRNYRENGVCVGVYSTCRAIGRLRYLERYMDPSVWSPEMVALRQLSIIENCNHHPLREQFAEFCMKRDKYRLGIDIPGFLDNIVLKAQEATDYMPDFLGYTKSQQGFKPQGIADWWIVKYLKSVR